MNSTPPRATLGSTRFDQEAGTRENLSQSISKGFLGKDEKSKVSSLGLPSMESSHRSYSLGAVSSGLRPLIGLLLGVLEIFTGRV